MKTKKLNLKDLKVDSFVTSLEIKDAQTVKGGATPTAPVVIVGASAALCSAAVVAVAGAFVAGVALGAGVAAGVIATTKK